MTLLFACVFFVCVDVGCVHPSYAEAGCVLIVLCIFLMLHFEQIKSTLYRKKRKYLPQKLGYQHHYLSYICRELFCKAWWYADKNIT